MNIKKFAVFALASAPIVAPLSDVQARPLSECASKLVEYARGTGAGLAELAGYAWDCIRD